ncbi:MAG: polyprenyl synthetase family protein, partial [Gammaproteobacteria bacterium]
MTSFAATLSAFDGNISRLNAHMRGCLHTEVSMAADIIMRQLAGGKRLRAVITMLSAKLCGLPQERGMEMATAIEFIHTATLLHDDVVDDADTRRRQAAANRIYGNAAAVLVGDFLYSRASQLLARMGSVRLLEKMTDATNRLSEGELLQLLARRSGNISREMYFSVIERKTANLFEIAAAGPAIYARQPAAEKALGEYGRRLGLAFQLVDDCLDYEGGDTGKEVGRDFCEGKMTLPV